MLSEEKPQEYIDGIENLLKTAKGKTLRNILELNLAAGYIEIKQFDIAIPMLEKLSHERLSGFSVNVVHKINLCLSYFETTQYEKAITVYNENQGLFQQYRHHKIYGGNIAILDIIAAIINEQYTTVPIGHSKGYLCILGDQSGLQLAYPHKGSVSILYKSTLIIHLIFYF